MMGDVNDISGNNSDVSDVSDISDISGNNSDISDISGNNSDISDISDTDVIGGEFYDDDSDDKTIAADMGFNTKKRWLNLPTPVEPQPEGIAPRMYSMEKLQPKVSFGTIASTNTKFTVMDGDENEWIRQRWLHPMPSRIIHITDQPSIELNGYNNHITLDCLVRMRKLISDDNTCVALIRDRTIEQSQAKWFPIYKLWLASPNIKLDNFYHRFDTILIVKYEHFLQTIDEKIATHDVPANVIKKSRTKRIMTAAPSNYNRLLRNKKI